MKGSVVCPRSGSLSLLNVSLRSTYHNQREIIGKDNVLDDLNVASNVHVSHGLWRDEYELPTHRASSSHDLSNSQPRSDRDPHGSPTIILKLTSRLTLSMKTSLAWSAETHMMLAKLRDTYNSSRHRIGDPMASHRANSKQMVENDFSPPDKVFVCRPLPVLVSSGSTYPCR